MTAGGDAFLVFFAPKRREGPLRIADLKATADRVEVHLNRKLVRLASPYLGTLRRVTVGFALAFYNPLAMPERLVSRLVEEAWACVHVQRAQQGLQNRCDLQEVLLADQLSTVQPVVDLKTRRVLGTTTCSRRRWPRSPASASPSRSTTWGRATPGSRSIEYGQGFRLGRPAAALLPPAPASPASSAAATS